MSVLAILDFVLVEWLLPETFRSFSQQMTFYLPVIKGFGILLLIFGGIGFLVNLLRGRGFGSLTVSNLVTGISPSGELSSSQSKTAHRAMIGPHYVSSVLGQGGMGIVYKGVTSKVDLSRSK